MHSDVPTPPAAFPASRGCVLDELAEEFQEQKQQLAQQLQGGGEAEQRQGGRNMFQ